MILMTECKYKKRLQFYLDGWTDNRSSKDIEKHLKHCSQCQIEIAELQEVTEAALEIVDQAPDREYWDSFTTRVGNRIVSRDIEPVLVERKPPRFLFFRLASILAIIMMVTVSMVVLFRLEGKIPQKPMAVIISPQSSETVQPKSDLSEIKQSAPIKNMDNLSESTTPKQTTVIPVILDSEKVQEMYASVAPDKSSDISSSALTVEDLSEQFHRTPLIDKASFRLDTEGRAVALTISGSPVSIDPSLRLRNSFVGQRLLAGLGMSNQSGAAIGNSGPLYGFNPASPAFAWEDFQNELSSSWGYLRIASDTSKSTEIKKYFIELELMQTR
jgi:hypothetical protein